MRYVYDENVIKQQQMEQIASNFPSSFQLTNSQHNIAKINGKNKNILSSTRKNPNNPNNNNLKQTILSSKTKSHTRENSHLRKSKSKCETEVNYSAKKKKTQFQTASKKTIPKKKKTVNITSATNNDASRHQIKTKDSNRFSSNKVNKDKQEPIILKNQKQKHSKQIFHSTCFSRNFDIDNINTGTISPDGHSSLFYQSYEHVQSNDQSAMGRIYDKTKQVMNKYKKKCQILNKNCQYYEKELNKAIQQIQYLKKSKYLSIKASDANIQNRQQQLNRNSLKKTNRKNRANTGFMRNSKSKNSCHKDYAHRNNSEFLL